MNRNPVKRSIFSCAMWIFLLCLVEFGCVPKEYPPTKNTDLNVCVRDPLCTDKMANGHRGTGSSGIWAPENTLAAFETAWKMGADSIEIDVRDTLDGVPVIMHDSDVDGTTDGSGRVDEMTLEQIKALHITPINPAIPVQEVPTLRETLALLHGKTLVDVDIKGADMAQLVHMIEEEGMLDAAHLEIGGLEEGLAARSAHAAVALMPKIASVAEAQQYVDVLGPIDFFEMEYEDATPELVEFVRSQGIKIHMDALGGLNDTRAGYQRYLDRGADILETDRLEALVPFVRGLAPKQGDICGR